MVEKETRAKRTRQREPSGFTLVELVMVIALLGIVAAVAVPKLSSVLDEAKRSATQAEMMALRRAIIGDDSSVSAGHPVSRGYEGDVAALPSSLADLVTKPGGVAAWDRYTQTGWNGPYVDSGGGYATDAWGNAYTYNSGQRTITSSAGGGTAITVNF